MSRARTDSAYLARRRSELTPIVIHWVHAGGTLALQADYAKFSVERSAELLDVTPVNAADRAFLAGVRGAVARLTVYATPDSGEAIESALAVGTFGTLVYGRYGDAPGTPRRGFPACVRRFTESLNAEGAAVFEIELQGTGAPLYGPGDVW